MAGGIETKANSAQLSWTGAELGNMHIYMEYVKLLLTQTVQVMRQDFYYSLHCKPGEIFILIENEFQD